MINTNPFDAWLDALPENVYDECPGSGGKKLRYVIKDGEEALEGCFHTFVQEQNLQEHPAYQYVYNRK